MTYYRKLSPLYLLAAAIVITPSNKCLAEEAAPSSCRSKLSKKGAMVYDSVMQKMSPNSILEELWKEVSRDLITADLLGREEATAPSEQALSCLKSHFR